MLDIQKVLSNFFVMHLAEEKLKIKVNNIKVYVYLCCVKNAHNFSSLRAPTRSPANHDPGGLLKISREL